MGNRVVKKGSVASNKIRDDENEKESLKTKLLKQLKALSDTNLPPLLEASGT